MVITDEATRKALPNLQELFFNLKPNVSGVFNDGRFAKEHEKSVHINPVKAVKLSENKGDLFTALRKEGYAVPEFAPAELFEEKGVFAIDVLQEKFPLSDPDLETLFTCKNKMTTIEDLAELLQLLGTGMSPGGAFFNLPKGYQSAVVSTIPNARGTNLNLGTTTTNNGILSQTLPSSLGADRRAEALELARNVVDELNLDYAHVTIALCEETMLVIDVETSLRRQDCVALRSYIDHLMKAQARKNNPLQNARRTKR